MSEQEKRRPKEKLRSHLNNIDVTYVFSDLQPHVVVMTSYQTINMDFISSWQWWSSNNTLTYIQCLSQGRHVKGSKVPNLPI
jgi:hypothetical protein